jgi:ribosome-interacting GTPase 1
LLVDLGDDDGPFAAQAVIDRLAQAKVIVAGRAPDAIDASSKWTKTLLAANKIDLPEASERLEIVRELFGARFPIQVISAETGIGLESLPEGIYRFLDVIRIYSKQPGKPPDMASPFTCPAGSTVLEMASLVHKDFAQGLKSARLWGTGVYDGQTVARDHVLHDKDVVELHA